MKIKANNTDRVQKALDGVQSGRMTARTVNTRDVAELAEAAEEYLDKYLPKKDRIGARAVYFQADLPNAYKYTAQTTRVLLERYATDWFLVEVDRINIRPGEPTFNKVFLPAGTQDAVMRRQGLTFLDPITVECAA